MEIILLERVEKLGQMGDVVKVKPGYARNFLLPQGKALRANKNNLERFETEKAQREADNPSHRNEAETEAGKMNGIAVSMVRAASEMGQLFGSVTSRDIAEAVHRLPRLLENLDKGAVELTKSYFSHYPERNRAKKGDSRFDFVFFLFIIAGIFFGSWLTNFLS